MNPTTRRYDLIAKATKFFGDMDRLALATKFEIHNTNWFICECDHSVHRESIFGYQPTYDKD